MPTLELREYEPRSVNIQLDPTQLRVLQDARIDVAPSTNKGWTYELKPSSWIGAANIGDLAIVVRPKIPIDRVMFLIAYALDPRRWRPDRFDLSRDADVLEAILLAFAFHTERAIQRGLLQGYRREDAALNTVRGRIRFDDQIKERFGIPLPLEVSFDEFTEDIEENRLLKTAIDRLGRMAIRSQDARRRVRALRPAFISVGLGAYHGRPTPEISYTRINRHYRPAVELARLIIENSSLELFHGKVVGASFFLDMNVVFERFLHTALREALDLSEREWRHTGEWPAGTRLTLDQAGRIRLKPDLTWWSEGRLRFVGDAKYKRIEPHGFKHADVYQMLAYCTAADLPSGLLVYAAGESEPRVHNIRYAEKTIEIASLNLLGSPDDILAEVRQLADRIKSPQIAATPALDGRSKRPA